MCSVLRISARIESDLTTNTHTHHRVNICIQSSYYGQSACSIIKKWGVGTVDPNIHIYYIPPFFELLVGLKEHE